ncbi:PAN domain-containing protein [Ensifer sp. NPDC090286]|uniref:PAN domain-containing protein n=1 Tax=Ensifer sp. NPDC090286 TaxID=3363991 RepID=UPI003839DD76
MGKLIAGVFRMVALVLAFALHESAAMAAEKHFGPFSVDDAHPGVIALSGEIDLYSALNFRRALQAFPDAKLLVLESAGGAVQMALLIADDVNQRGLSTYIAKDNGCYSACAFIFLAGSERQVDGELGVHQISSGSNDLINAQLSISDIIDMLARFGTPAEVMTTMFKTPPSEMHVFSKDEIERFALNRKSANNLTQSSQIAATPSASPADTRSEASSAPNAAPTSNLPVAASSASAVTTSTTAGLSAIEEFSRKPTRIALYTGLDLFGDDIASKRTGDAAECARSCLELNGTCKAFTFNADPKILRGPNCFLKSREGRADGNSVAVSGKFLTGADPNPSPFSIGTIDPKQALFDDVDLPGGDIHASPSLSNATALQCRLACIDSDRCTAFTYIKRKRECWLKATVGTPVFKVGMTSGVKNFQRFAPATIVTLD